MKKYLIFTAFFIILCSPHGDVESYGELSADGYTVGLWYLNETSGTNCADETGSHDGTASGSPPIINGWFGNARDIQSNDYISFADHADFTITASESQTWEFIFKADTLPDWAPIWSQINSDGDALWVYIGGGGVGTDGVVAYFVSGSDQIASSNNNVVTIGTWHYIAITRNGSGGAITFYVDGVDETSDSIASISTINPTDIRIGRDSMYGDSFNGKVDSVRYRKDYLAPAGEIRGTYSLIKGGYGIQ